MTIAANVEAFQPHLLYAAHTLIARNDTANSTSSNSLVGATRPPVYKFIGLSLAVASGLFIGVSFVLKKIGLLKANVKYNEEAGEGYGYLKNAHWWGGMSLMILGEICNFVAYAFTDAILVTPLGALSVVVTTILSAIFLKERLSFVGKVGCFNCIIGSVIIVLNAPQQSAVADIQEMKNFVVAPGFLSYAGVVIVGSAFIALYLGPRYGKKTMFVYLSVCSFIGGLSVVATQGLGAAVVAQVQKGNQFNQWFLYVLLVFVVATLLTEIIFLNKALNLFNAALVTPTYYVFFTSTTIITSAILFRGFHGTAVGITTVIMGFLVICTGVVLLQLSKSAKDVPDAAIFKGDLDQVREVAEQEQSEIEPKADAIRGAASIVRRLSTPRRHMEQAEARRLREEKLADLQPLNENEVVEWDGLRRRKTIIGMGPTTSPAARRKTMATHVGMTDIPEEGSPANLAHRPSVIENVKRRAQTMIPTGQARPSDAHLTNPVHPMALTDIRLKSSDGSSPALPYGPGSIEEAQEHIFGYSDPKHRLGVFTPKSKPLPASPVPSPGLLSVDGAKRQFSFSNMFRHSRQSGHSTDTAHPRPSTAASHVEKKAMKNATEEERLGLVQGDSSRGLLQDTSPERSRDKTSQAARHPSSPEFPTIFHSQSSRYHRSASPDAITEAGVVSDDDDAYQVPNPSYQREPFSFASSDPGYKAPKAAEQAKSASRGSSRRRPSPPAIYTPPPPVPPIHSIDPSQLPQQSLQIPALPPPQQAIRRVTIGSRAPSDQSVNETASRPTASLQPPIQFNSSSDQHASQHSSPIPSMSQSREDLTRPSASTPNLISAATTLPAPVRGRPVVVEGSRDLNSESASVERSGEESKSSSKDRYAEQSAREREERRARAQKRMSTGRDV